jgi:nucleoside-diphosphate-sugar epimerase
MGYHKFIRAMLHDQEITIFGDGQQVRGNTYVSDCVAATMAATQAIPGETYNVGGGETASVWDILTKLEAITGRKARTKLEPERPGDQRYTFADTTKLRRHLGWQPAVGLDEGLRKQWEWQAGQEAEDRSALEEPAAVRASTGSLSQGAHGVRAKEMCPSY